VDALSRVRPFTLQPGSERRRGLQVQTRKIRTDKRRGTSEAAPLRRQSPCQSIKEQRREAAGVPNPAHGYNNENGAIASERRFAINGREHLARRPALQTFQPQA
jgi:hypothetical protein